MFGIILKIDKGRIQTNRPEAKKLITIHKALHSRVDYMYQEKKRRELASIESTVDASIRAYKNYIKKNKEELAQSAGAVEYTDCTSVAGVRTPQ